MRFFWREISTLLVNHRCTKQMLVSFGKKLSLDTSGDYLTKFGLKSRHLFVSGSTLKMFLKFAEYLGTMCVSNLCG